MIPAPTLPNVDVGMYDDCLVKVSSDYMGHQIIVGNESQSRYLLSTPYPTRQAAVDAANQIVMNGLPTIDGWMDYQQTCTAGAFLMFVLACVERAKIYKAMECTNDRRL